jgi:subtilisin family serine protease
MAKKTKPAGTAQPTRRSRPAPQTPETREGAELIVVAKAAAGLRVRRGGAEVASLGGANVRGLTSVLAGGVRFVPLFGNEDRVVARAAAAAAETGRGGPDLSVFYKVEAPTAQLAALARALVADDSVEAAYIKPAAEPPAMNDVPPDMNDAPPVTPDFTASQIYLGAAPGGVEALWAHTRPGGKGDNIRIIDIEGAWRFSHEDLMQVQGGVVGGAPSTNIGWRNHGTAVIGEFGGDENAFGVTGIAPNANTRAISIFGPGQGSAKAIHDAADLLSPGDVILIELHRPGPRFNFASRSDQLGYIAVEWWEDDWAAIKYATNKGVIVVEAGGNGAENLDDGIYSVKPAGFPAAWTNPFNRGNRDSGAILVGAGAPPPGTHGRDHGPDRSRLDFSNYGASVDTQGWGREVTTCGYGNLQGGSNEDLWYTDTFSGTSSASPIIVGVVASLQGNRKAQGQPVYAPAQVRAKLRSTGSTQNDAPGRPATQRIGNRPNLKQLIGGIVKPLKEVAKDVIKDKELKAEKIEIKEHKVEAKEVKNEAKELKAEKLEIKEVQKEKVEIKEIQKELDKQFEKQVDKNLEKRVEKRVEKRIEKLADGGQGGLGGGGTPQAGGFEARLGALEAAVSQLTHFIGSQLRPDLSQGALTGEGDLGGMQQQLEGEGAAAKWEKDNTER